MPRSLPLFLVLTLAAPTAAQDKDKAPPKPPADKTVEQLAEAAKRSVVVIRGTGRDGKQEGIGSGFVVSADGLIATNLHVIGEGRPITLLTADGKRYDVTAVHASDRSLDLALLKVNAKDLPALELGDSDALKDGQAVVALGHPRGLQHSVVAGVVSGRRPVEGRPMIQLAMPIEQGNSGGPVLDLQGRVRGIVTLKSQVTPNLGFAVPVNALKNLLKKPNPVPMERWVTLGAINGEEWEIVFDGRWRSRGGRIIADGVGAGFGGRSLCLAKQPVPELPYEITVALKLEDEAGAGGLIFHADGGDKHYGFYPSAGKMRFVRFEGPDVFSWKILHNEASAHYRPGEWNTLKVRVEKGRIRCYVNDELAHESTDDGLTSGRVGLAKFRNSHLEFKNFQVGKTVPASRPAAAVVERVTKAAVGLPAEGKFNPDLVGKLASEAASSQAVLRARAAELERQAARLRDLAVAVHHESVVGELSKATTGNEDKIDLINAALLIARLDNAEVDVAAYRRQVEALARQIAAAIPKTASEQDKVAALNKALFEDRGFHGSRADYYNRSNSYLNEVLDDREGLPITLSLLYLELGRRLGLKIEGVGLPGHFIVRHVPAKGKPQLIDVYESGKPMSRAQADEKVQAITGEPLTKADLEAVGKRAILVRILVNLRGLAKREGNPASFLRYQDAIVAVTPDDAEERGLRAGVRYQTGDRQGALTDLDWLLERNPPGLDRERVLELKRIIQRGG